MFCLIGLWFFRKVSCLLYFKFLLSLEKLALIWKSFFFRAVRMHHMYPLSYATDWQYLEYTLLYIRETKRAKISGFTSINEKHRKMEIISSLQLFYINKA